MGPEAPVTRSAAPYKLCRMANGTARLTLRNDGGDFGTIHGDKGHATYTASATSLIHWQSLALPVSRGRQLQVQVESAMNLTVNGRRRCLVQSDHHISP